MGRSVLTPATQKSVARQAAGIVPPNDQEQVVAALSTAPTHHLKFFLGDGSVKPGSGGGKIWVVGNGMLFILSGVKLLRSILAFGVLALWLVATHHCQLEDVPSLAFLRCASPAPTSSHCDGDSCQIVESGAYKISETRAHVVAPLVARIAPAVVLENAATAERTTAFKTLPPELSQSWQFISRTALPIRAPSIVS